MSEKTAKPISANQSITNLNWADTATAGTDYVQPASSLRNSGWVSGDAIPYNVMNWFWRTVSLAIAWIQSWRIRAYDDTRDAVGEGGSQTPGSVYIIGEGESALLHSPLESVSTIAMANAGADIALDGGSYYLSDGVNLSEYDAIDASSFVESSADILSFTPTISRVSTDGFWVLTAAQANASGAEIFFTQCTDTDGGIYHSYEISSNVRAIESNGVEFVWASGTLSAHLLTIGAGIGTVTSVSHGTQVDAVCIDHDTFYFAGQAGTGGNHVRARTIAAGATVWDAIIASTSGTPSPNDMCCDGEYVYVVGDNITDSGETFNVWCYSRLEGRLLWRADIGGDDASGCCVDDRYLYMVVPNNSEVYAVDKRNGHVLFKADTLSSANFCDCDGQRLVVSGGSGGGAASAQIYSTGRGTQFHRAESIAGNRNRRPFYKRTSPLV